MNTIVTSFSNFSPSGAHAVFWEYFTRLHQEAGNKIPVRTDFDPLKIAPILHKMAVSEYIDDQTQIVRLIGGAHDNLWPVSMAGKNLYDYIDADIAEERRKIYKEIMRRPCGCLVDDEMTDQNGHQIQYSGLILPTLSHGGAPTILIGCYEFGANDIEMQLAGDTGIEKRKTQSVTYIDLTP